MTGGKNKSSVFNSSEVVNFEGIAGLLLQAGSEMKTIPTV